MTRPIIILWFIAACASLWLMGAGTRAYVHGRSEASTARSLLRHDAEQAAAIATLQGGMPPWTAAPPADPNLLSAQVSDALAAADVPTTALLALLPDADRDPPSTPGALPVPARRRATVTLAPLTLPDLGRFIDAWQRRQSGSGSAPWTFASFDVIPLPQAPPGPPGAAQPLRVVFTLESIWLPHTGVAP